MKWRSKKSALASKGALQFMRKYQLLVWMLAWSSVPFRFPVYRVGEICIYVFGNVYIIVYMDDLLIWGSNRRKIKEIIWEFWSSFLMKVMGSISRYLGIDVVYDQEKGIMSSSQAKYIKQLALKYRVADSQVKYETLMEAALKLDKLDLCPYGFTIQKPDWSFVIRCSRYSIRYIVCYESAQQVSKKL